MNRFLLFIFFHFLFAGIISAQTGTDSTTVAITDSLTQKDTTIKRDTLLSLPIADSVSKMLLKDSGWTINLFIPFSFQNLDWQILKRHPYFGFNAISSKQPQPGIRQFIGKEFLFYLILFLLLFFAFLRRTFPKYFNDLFRLFFRTTLKQRQIREQLMQTPLPSLLLNVFFVISTGLYITFILQHFQLNPVGSFWLLFLYGCLGLSAVYFIKFLGLKISGWLFNMQEAANVYIFIVFIVNKMIGILLLPFLILLAFTLGDIYSVGLTISWCVVVGLLIYRFILTYASIRNQVKVNPFHFFLYFCAFEIAPLLLIYKGLLLFFRITA